jgi:hypothetical protein
VEFFFVVFVSFGGCSARFLITESSFFQQPPTTRDRILDAVRFFEVFLGKRRRPRRRVDPDLFRRLVDGLFELILM